MMMRTEARKRSSREWARRARAAGTVRPTRRQDKQRHQLKYRHGLTPGQVGVLWLNQRGICPVCAEGLGDDTRIDHDHQCCPDRSCGGCVRGILHDRCNLGMGILEDDPARLRRAADYLEVRRGVG